MAPMNPDQDGIEITIQDISQRLESLKTEFNLYFAGELQVPPEKERTMLEKKIRNLMYTGKKTARVNLLIQNVSSRFSLYNNMWLKRMNDIETGVTKLQKKRVASMDDDIDRPKRPKKKEGVRGSVSLNSEDSFEKLYDKYADMLSKNSQKVPDKEKMINSIKTKMISSNVIDAKVNISVEKGKLKVKIKSSH